MTSLKDLIAGLFVLVSVLLFLAFLAWAGKIRSFFHETRTVRVLVDRLPPMPAGAAVRYEGVQVGEMVDLRLRTAEERTSAHAELPVQLTLRVAASLRLTTAHTAVVTGDGMLGARYVRLQADRGDAPPLPPDAVLVGRLAGIDGILDRSEAVVQSLDRLLVRLDNLLDPAGGPETLPGLLQRVGTLSDEVVRLAGSFEATNRQATEALAQARTLLDRLTGVVAENAPDLRRMIEGSAGLPGDARELAAAARAAIDQTNQQVSRLADQLASTLRHVDDLVLRNDRNLFLTLHHARVAAEELKLAIARVRADPSQVLFGGSEDPAAAEAAVKKSLERDLIDRGLLPPRWQR